MASIIKANELQDFGGNSIITSDGAGNVTVNAAAMKNTPAFSAYGTTPQSVSSGTFTKVVFDAEDYDTDNAYDNATNYRFTVPSGAAGKYWCYATVRADGTASTFNYMILSFYKNGSAYPDNNRPFWRFLNNPIDDFTGTLGFTIDLNGSTDYIEVFTEIELSSGNPTLARGCSFGAYKLIT